MLEKRVGMHLMGMDVFVNIVGGLKIDEPAVDLGVIAAVASSFREKPINAQTVVMGEVGLAGEVRAISQAESTAQGRGQTRFHSLRAAGAERGEDGEDLGPQEDGTYGRAHRG